MQGHGADGAAHPAAAQGLEPGWTRGAVPQAAALRGGCLRQQHRDIWSLRRRRGCAGSSGGGAGPSAPTDAVVRGK